MHNNLDTILKKYLKIYFKSQKMKLVFIYFFVKV